MGLQNECVAAYPARVPTSELMKECGKDCKPLARANSKGYLSWLFAGTKTITTQYVVIISPVALGGRVSRAAAV
jgi:hypothetical protein